MPLSNAALCLICVLAIGCEATTSTPMGTGQLASNEALIEYAGLMRRLFDDEFGGIALGSAWNDSLAEQNALLSKRIMSAGSILRCVVGTVTEGSIDHATATSVEFRTSGVSLLKNSQAGCPRIAIASTSYSYSVLRQSGMPLVGKSVVIFFRNFNENGATSWHWHVEPDRPEIRDLVGRLRGPIN